MAIVIGIIVSIVASGLVCELYAWLPALSNKLLDWAVRRLPSCLQQRYREEWQAHLDGTPNSLWRMVAALGLRVSARGLCLNRLRTAEGELQDLFSTSEPQLNSLTEAFRKLSEQHDKRSRHWETVRPSIAATMCGDAGLGTAEERARWRDFLGAMDAFAAFAKTEFRDTKRMVELITTAFVTARERYEHLSDGLSHAERADTIQLILDDVDAAAEAIALPSEWTSKSEILLREVQNRLPK